MNGTVTLESISDDLKSVKNDLVIIKNRIIDADSVLTEDDYMALEEYRKEKSEGKLVSHEEVKKRLDCDV